MNKSTRVRYKLISERLYASTQSFLGNEGTLLYVTVNLDCNTVTVLKNEGELVEEASCKSFSHGKVLAKKLLAKYGVTFLDEVRKKKGTV